MIDESILTKAFDAAKKARNNSYSPYSGYAVGSAIICQSDDEHRIFSGTNVENSSYGATICAERAAILNMVSNSGHKKIEAVVVVSAGEPLAVPCAVCLQVMAEFCRPDTLIAIGTPDSGIVKRYTFAELLPHPFLL
ncbi:MAG: cytidine deaminase [Spirochaetaceae bacterium]|nr:MAG: cytidine deaminase [Spirochaetaceae bacterium]